MNFIVKITMHVLECTCIKICSYYVCLQKVYIIIYVAQLCANPGWCCNAVQPMQACMYENAQS